MKLRRFARIFYYWESARPWPSTSRSALQKIRFVLRRSGLSCWEDQVCLAQKIRFVLRFVLRRRWGSSSDSSCGEDEVRPQIRLVEKIRFVLRFVLRRKSGSSSGSSCAEDQVRLAEKGHRKLAELVQILVVAMSRMIIRSVRKRNARFLSNRFPSVTQTNICTILFTRSNLVTPRNNIHISRKVTAFCCILLFPSLSFSSSHISGTWCAKRS